MERGAEWNPEATGSLLGAAVIYGGANGIMNYLNTGEAPKSIWDLLNFRTGNFTTSGQPKRGLIPTEFKELYDIGHILVDAIMAPSSVPHGIMNYFAAKENSMMQALTTLLTGEDAIGHKIAWTPGGWGKYFLDSIIPIIFKAKDITSGLNRLERTFIREAPSWVEDTEAYFAKMTKLHGRWTKEELQRAGKEAALYGEAAPEGYQAPGSRGAGQGTQRSPEDQALRAQIRARYVGGGTGVQEIVNRLHETRQADGQVGGVNQGAPRGSVTEVPTDQIGQAPTTILRGSQSPTLGTNRAPARGGRTARARRRR